MCEKATSKNCSAWDFLERGRARGKRAFASGKLLGLESAVCCARNFSGEKFASKNISARVFFKRGQARGKRTLASGRNVSRFGGTSAVDGSIAGLIDRLLNSLMDGSIADLLF